MKLLPLFTWRSAIVESDLPAPTKHVALTLSLHMNERGASAFPSLVTLAKEASRGKNTIITALSLLEREGFLTVQRGGGRGRPNVYQASSPNSSMAEPFRAEKGSVADRNGAASEPGGRKEDVTEANASVPARPKDHLWDALADELGEPATRSERGRRNKAVKELRDVGATVDEVRLRIARYRACWPTIELTATGLASNWSLLAEPRTVRREVRGTHGSSMVEVSV